MPQFNVRHISPSPGDRVKHDLWGCGTVISARGVGALVEFAYLGYGVLVSASGLETLSA